MLNLELLEKEYENCLNQRNKAQEMFHQLSGAISLLEQQIKVIKECPLENKEDIESENEKG